MVDESGHDGHSFAAEMVEGSNASKSKRGGSSSGGSSRIEGIFKRDEGAHQAEIEKDPERVVMRVRASMKWTLIEMLAILVSVGLCSGGLAVYLVERTVFGIYFSTYQYETFLLWLGCLPPPLVLGLRLKAYYLRAVSVFEISRRFITSSVFKIIYFQTETCDMTNVVDITFKNFGPVASIILETSDQTCPVIHMGFIETCKARELVGFIRAHATNTYVEMRTSRKNNEY